VPTSYVDLTESAERDAATDAPAVKYVLFSPGGRGPENLAEVENAVKAWLSAGRTVLYLPQGSTLAALDVANGRVLWEVRG
jgi:hypothetical protein